MRATRRRIAVLLICVASAFTCEIALAEPLYRFGVPPWQRGQSVDDIRRLYNPLLDYLGRAADAKITIVTARSYEDMVHYFADEPHPLAAEVVDGIDVVPPSQRNDHPLVAVGPFGVRRIPA